MQHYIDIWLSELYLIKPYSALGGKMPGQAFKEDQRTLRWASKEQLNSIKNTGFLVKRPSLTALSWGVKTTVKELYGFEKTPFTRKM